MKICKKTFCVLMGMLLWTSILAQSKTTHLQGRVMLNDTLPAAYATLFLPEYGIGTVTNDEGNYWMDNVPVASSVTLEYAYLGYKTKHEKLALTVPNHHYAHDVRLEEQLIALSEVYLTPNGEDPATYIFRKVQEQSKVNRKRLTDYTAKVDAYLITRDADLFQLMMPSALWSTVTAGAKMAGYGAILDYATSSPNVKVHYDYTQTKTNGKLSTTAPHVVSADPAIPEKASKKLEKSEDIFNLLYEENLKINPKRAVKDGWKLKGVVEEQGHDVDVLTRTVYKDSVKTTYTVYVIEDLWTILRYEEDSQMGLERYECRDIGGGIYMPVSLITQPLPLDFDDEMKRMSEMLDMAMKAQGVTDPKDIDFSMKGKGLKAKMLMKMAKGTIIRMKTLHDSGRTFKPLFDTPFTIRYSGVKVEK